VPLTKRQYEKKIFDGGKAGDVANLMEQGQADVIADARCGSEQGEVAAGRSFGELEQVFFQDRQLRVKMSDEGQVVLQGKLADGVGFRGEELFFPRLTVVRPLATDWSVVS